MSAITSSISSGSAPCMDAAAGADSGASDDGMECINTLIRSAIGTPTPSNNPYPITLSFRGHAKLHHLYPNTTFMYLLYTVQKRFAAHLLHNYAYFRFSFFAYNNQYQISDEEDWQQYLIWLSTTYTQVVKGSMTLQQWKHTTTIYMEAIDMNGNGNGGDYGAHATGTVNETSPSSVSSPDENWSPATDISTLIPSISNSIESISPVSASDLDVDPAVAPPLSLDVVSSLLLQISAYEVETSQKELNQLYTQLKQHETASTADKGNNGMNEDEIAQDQSHLLDGVEMVPTATATATPPLTLYPGPDTAIPANVITTTLPLPLPLPISLPTPVAADTTTPTSSTSATLTPISTVSSITALNSSPPAASSLSSSPSPSASAATASGTAVAAAPVVIRRSALRGRTIRTTPRVERHRMTDATRYSRLSSSMAQLRSLVSVYAKEHPEEMVTKVVMEIRNGVPRRRKISHRAKVLDDTTKMITGLKRQHHELQQKIAAKKQKFSLSSASSSSSSSSITTYRAMYMSVCLSALINFEMHPSLASSGIHVFRAQVSGLVGDIPVASATHYGYTVSEIFYKTTIYDIWNEISLPIEWDGLDMTQDLTKTWMTVLDNARGTEQIKPKSEEWWKARYGLVLPFIVCFRHPAGDLLYNIYFRQYQCCIITNQPYIVNVATMNAEIRIHNPS